MNNLDKQILPFINSSEFVCLQFNTRDKNSHAHFKQNELNALSKFTISRSRHCLTNDACNSNNITCASNTSAGKSRCATTTWMNSQ